MTEYNIRQLCDLVLRKDLDVEKSIDAVWHVFYDKLWLNRIICWMSADKNSLRHERKMFDLRKKHFYSEFVEENMQTIESSKKY
jgi:hypothetical protein